MSLGKRTVWIHIMMIIMVLVIPWMLNAWIASAGTHRLTPLTPMLMIVVVFYINSLWLVDKFFFTKNKWWLFITINLLIVVCMSILVQQYHLHLAPPPHDGIAPPRPMPEEGFAGDFTDISVLVKLGFFHRDLLTMLLSIGLSVAIKSTERWVKVQHESEEMIALQRENELRNLKLQINPHFLFNTLNNIYSLIGIDADKARSSVHKLSKLLRHVLYDDVSEKVPLQSELDFISNYIALMSLRLNDNVDLRVNICDGREFKVAPLLLIVLVENAFKHGVAQDKKSWIDISIKVIERNLICRVSNSYFPKGSSDKSGSGIGISNMLRQLMLLYPDKHKYEVTKDEQQYSVLLTIEM